MEEFLESLRNKLIKKNINPTYQRIKILEYLIQKNMHPTAEEIYFELHDNMASLSKMTVYNTLKIFVEAGLVSELTIENNEVRYDIITENHGHFKCDRCGEIYNFTINIDLYDAVNFDELEEFMIKQKNLYFKGLCPACLKNK